MKAARSVHGVNKMGFDPVQFRRALGRFATGVTIVTTRVNDETHGVTANSFTSVSLDPPLVLVCIDNRSRTRSFITEAGAFAINVLAEDQRKLSDFFARRQAPDLAHELDTIPHHNGETRAPVIEGSLAFFDCHLRATLEGGDHTIFIGEVVDMNADEDARPLVFYKGKYHQLPADET